MVVRLLRADSPDKVIGRPLTEFPESEYHEILHAAVDIDSNLLLEVDVFSRTGLAPRQHSCPVSCKNSMLPIQCFSWMLAAI
jgi:hypothetical protein